MGATPFAANGAVRLAYEDLGPAGGRPRNAIAREMARMAA